MNFYKASYIQNMKVNMASYTEYEGLHGILYRI